MGTTVLHRHIVECTFTFARVRVRGKSRRDVSNVSCDVRLFGLRGTALCEEALCSFFFNVLRVLIQVSLFSTLAGDAWNERRTGHTTAVASRRVVLDGTTDVATTVAPRWVVLNATTDAWTTAAQGRIDGGGVRVGWAFSWWNNLQGNTSDSADDRLLERSQEYDDGRCLCQKGSKQRQLGRNIFFFDVEVPVYGREEAVRKFAEKIDSRRSLRGTRWKLSGCRLLCHCRFSQLCLTYEQKRVHREMYPGAHDRQSELHDPPPSNVLNYLHRLREEPLRAILVREVMRTIHPRVQFGLERVRS